MTDETNNLPLGGTDNVNPSETDTFDEADDLGPDEQDTLETEAESEPDGETDEAAPADAESQEADEAEPEPVSEDALVRMADGKTVSVKELIRGQLRQADYTRKSQELATARDSVKADATRIGSIAQTFADHLQKLIPAMPDGNLAVSNPGKYVAQKAQHEAAWAQVEKLIELGEQAQTAVSQVTEAQTRERMAEENHRLSLTFPETATTAGRQKFFARALEAAEAAGFSADEVGGISDHRLFIMAHWAKKGMEAEAAKAKVKVKAESAPPVAPRKPGHAAAKANSNDQAMRRLARTGSLQDAAKVDWV